MKEQYIFMFHFMKPKILKTFSIVSINNIDMMGVVKDRTEASAKFFRKENTSTIKRSTIKRIIVMYWILISDKSHNMSFNIIQP